MADSEDFCEQAQDALAPLIAAADPGAMLTRFVLVAEVVDAEGQRALWSATAPGAKAWDTLGLIEWARAQEAAGIIEDSGES